MNKRIFYFSFSKFDSRFETLQQNRRDDMEESENFEQHWLLSSSIQRVKYLKLLSAYPKTTWTEEEKKVFLWLCQMDIDTLETMEIIFSKLAHKK